MRHVPQVDGVERGRHEDVLNIRVPQNAIVAVLVSRQAGERVELDGRRGQLVVVVTQRP